MSCQPEDEFATSCFASLLQSEIREEIIPVDLHTASLIGDEDIVRDYIKQKGNLNGLNHSGWTALMYAAYVGRYNILNLLVQAKADINMSSKKGVTALMLASYFANEQIAHFLLQHGANVNACDSSGMTSLYHAVRRGHQSAVTLLAIYHADPNIRADTGLTPIMEAAIAGHDTIFSTLLEYGADIYCRTKKGENLRSLAMRYGNQIIVMLLERHWESFMRAPREEQKLSVNSDINMTDGTRPEMVATDMNRFDNERYLLDSLPLPKTLKELLEQYQIGKFLPKFEQQGIDIAGFLELSDNDLKDMGFDKLGPRKKICVIIAWCRERSNMNDNPVVDHAQTEKMQAKIQTLNAKLHESCTYIKKLEMSQQQYRADFTSYMLRVSQLVFDMEDVGKNCKEAIGQIRKIKDFTSHTNTMLQKVREHPNAALISTELGIDNTYIDLANSAKGNMEIACNRIELSFRQVERTLGVVRNYLTQPSQG